MRRKIIGREDKSFVATVVGMPTTIKSMDSTNFMRNVNNKLRKNSHSIGSQSRWKSKPPAKL
jgi:hypothetical protein